MAYLKAGDNEWLIKVDVGAIKRVDGLMGIRLDKVMEDEMAVLLDVMTDVVKTVDVLWILVEPEATQKGITAEQFGESLVGDAIEDAAEALGRAIAEFFPKRQRLILEATLGRAKAYGETLAQEVGKVTEMIAAIPDETMKSTSLNSVTNGQV